MRPRLPAREQPRRRSWCPTLGRVTSALNSVCRSEGRRGSRVSAALPAELTCEEAARAAPLELHERRCLFAAALKYLRATGVEAAAAGRRERRRKLALQARGGARSAGIEIWNGGEQRSGVGALGALEERARLG